MTAKIIAIISDNSFLYKALVDNYQSRYQIILVNEDWVQNIKSYNKFDLLIIDRKIDASFIPYYKIANIINLTSNVISESEFSLTKPYRLSDIISFIDYTQSKDFIFFAINGNLIYDERLSSIKSSFEEVKLTAKENQIIRLLVISGDYSISKEQLVKDVWNNYHKDTESTTVDVHLYKLKQKLPPNLLQIKNDKYSLEIDI